MRIVILLCVYAAAGVPLAGAADGGVQGSSSVAPLPPEKRESVRQLMALFIITLILLVIMVAVMVILLVVMRKRLRALERDRPQLPTELEDLWWQMGLPEDKERKKPE